MLYYKNLQEIVFHHHELFDVDQLIILSGYVGPEQIRRLNEIGINSTVIYGMYGAEKIGSALHKAICNVRHELHHTEVLYSQMPVHSKCYVWLKDGKVQTALVGSANFSDNGLLNPYREVLADTSRDAFEPLREYIDIVLDSCIKCTESEVKFKKAATVKAPTESLVGRLSLLSSKGATKGQVPSKSGLNWGFSEVAHVSKGDAYIAISADFIRANEGLIPPKQAHPTREHEGGRKDRHNDIIDLIWDDGTLMQGLLEQDMLLDGKVYPKALSSSPSKKTIGQYIRRRMNLPDDKIITATDLLSYGRTDIGISKQGEGIYALDFSV